MEKLNFLVVFTEGILSLLSPCVLPIIPVYIAILTGSTSKKDDLEDRGGNPILNTILFVLGISSTFFILGFTINHFSNVLVKNKQTMNIVGGILIILMGLFFMGLLKLPSFSGGSKAKSNIQKREMGPLTSFLLGFTFSWGWSPCVGPMLASAVIMASNSGSRLHGNLMILVYTLGFILPFLIIAIFYDRIAHHLDKIEEHSDKIKKIGGILLIITGLLMATGGMDRFAGTINKDSEVNLQDEIGKNNSGSGEDKLPVESNDREEPEEEDEEIEAPDFTLEDQYGNTHTLSDYKGKLVFLNFWATWCPPCVKEMPDIQKIYEERGYNKEDVIVLGVAMPEMGKEGDIDHIKNFLKEHKIDYPVVFDNSGELSMYYQIQSFPNTFIINKDGNVEGVIPGAVPKETFDMVIDQTLEN